MTTYELNLDGLVGPTHHYAGLASGNIASIHNALSIANPAAAAHQGIEKMRLLHRLGIKQAIMPPHQRPNLELLHALGFTGTPIQQIKQAKKAGLTFLSACYSASSMWTANAATVSAGQDTADKRIHFTAANLVSHLHRQQEAATSKTLLTHLFSNDRYFYHHPILPATMTLADEGAANHSRLCGHYHSKGIYLFVYGKRAWPSGHRYPSPHHFTARQTLEASTTIARSHGLCSDQVVFACQNPDVIDQGVFHNDVIAVANEYVLLIHEDAFLNQQQVLAELRAKTPFPLCIIEVSRQHISVKDAIKSYFFNSQLITLPKPPPNMALILPSECEQQPHIKTYIDEILASPTNPIAEAHYIHLRQSMRNGGGPACLRLRIPLTENALAAMHQGVLVNETLLTTLDKWIDNHYRTHLHANDLEDPHLILESFSALNELTSILNVGNIYPFQLEKRNV